MKHILTRRSEHEHSPFVELHVPVLDHTDRLDALVLLGEGDRDEALPVGTDDGNRHGDSSAKSRLRQLSARLLRRLFEQGEPPDVPTHPLLYEDLLRGGLPVVCLRQVKDAGPWFRGYEQTYLERDVRQISRTSDIVAFPGGWSEQAP